MALAIGVVYAQRRLKTKNIFSTSPKRINLAGGINLALFDKTGTLTEEGLSFYGLIANSTNFLATKIEKGIDEISRREEISRGMAICHSLASINGEIIGDPLEKEIFLATKKKLIINESAKVSVQMDGETKISQLKPFAFTSDLARQSVISIVNDEKYVHVKGAPEIMKTLCSPKSLPQSYDRVLDVLSSQGFRIIALCGKRLHEKFENSIEVSLRA